MLKISDERRRKKIENSKQKNKNHRYDYGPGGETETVKVKEDDRRRVCEAARGISPRRSNREVWTPWKLLCCSTAAPCFFLFGLSKRDSNFVFFNLKIETTFVAVIRQYIPYDTLICHAKRFRKLNANYIFIWYGILFLFLFKCIILFIMLNFFYIIIKF